MIDILYAWGVQLSFVLREVPANGTVHVMRLQHRASSSRSVYEVLAHRHDQTDYNERDIGVIT